MDQREGISNFREVDANGKAVPATDDSNGNGGWDDSAAGRSGRGQFGKGPSGLSRINPFIVALWLMAALLLGFGLWVFTVPTMGMNDISPPLQQFTYLMMTFAPWATIAGVAIFACLLFWHAGQWQRRRDASG